MIAKTLFNIVEAQLKDKCENLLPLVGILKCKADF